jgi:D-sedoheptulose 7-phosphate isomerase
MFAGRICIWKKGVYTDMAHAAKTDKILSIIKAHQSVVDDVQTHAETIQQLVSIAVEVYGRGGKIVLCGNGGSAADAQHWATELVCRYKKNRKSLAAIALTTDTSLLTATANDFGFDDIFARQVEALVASKDMVIGISTSGNSPNVLKAMQKARDIGAVTVGFTSAKDTRLSAVSDVCFKINASETGRIQEGHELIGHIFCELVEETLFP